MNNATISPFAKHTYVMIKPIGSLCNLRCDYCYYLEKKDLYPNEKKFRMSDELLEEFTQQYIASQTMGEVLFTWHGGETLMRKIEFYEKAIEFQKKYSGGRRIQNSIQTNGTLLTAEWCKFFKENDFLVGISIDGSQKFNDKYRRNVEGKSTFYQVINGIKLLKKYKVEFNIMAVVNDYNVNYPLEFYQFFKDIDCHFIQFSPIVERLKDGSMAPWNVPADKWGDFLIAIFDQWVKKDVGNYFVQYFDSALALWMDMSPGTCIMAKKCGHAGVMEFNGDVYSCDHFVYPKYKLGNIKERSITEMMYSAQQQKFGNDKADKLPKQCKQCEFLFACNGECPKNRIIKTEDGEDNLNYLCVGYYKFFKHIAPYMDFMKKELLAKRSAANIMDYLRMNRL